VAHSNGNSHKEKPKKPKDKGAPIDPQQAVQPEQLVAPVETDVVQGNGQSDQEEKEKGPKKQRWA
jgi:hypothetical protein